MFYSVCFYHSTTGEHTLSRSFQTIRAARKWAKWLGQQSYAARTAIYRGGPGGEVVA